MREAAAAHLPFGSHGCAESLLEVGNPWVFEGLEGLGVAELLEPANCKRLWTSASSTSQSTCGKLLTTPCKLGQTRENQVLHESLRS